MSPPDRVQHDIDIRNLARKILGSIVEDLIGSKFPGDLHTIPGSGGDDAGAKPSGQLDGEAPDTPGTGMHQYSLTGLKICGLYKGLPGCSCSGWQSGCVVEVHLFRNKHQLVFRHDGVVRKGAALGRIEPCHDPVPQPATAR